MAQRRKDLLDALEVQIDAAFTGRKLHQRQIHRLPLRAAATTAVSAGTRNDPEGLRAAASCLWLAWGRSPERLALFGSAFHCAPAVRDRVWVSRQSRKREGDCPHRVSCVDSICGKRLNWPPRKASATNELPFEKVVATGP